MKLIRNAAQCPLCHDVVESRHRHDWRGCSCGHIYVDGGLAYTRRGWKSSDGPPPIELSEYESDQKTEPGQESE